MVEGSVRVEVGFGEVMAGYIEVNLDTVLCFFDAFLEPILLIDIPVAHNTVVGDLLKLLSNITLLLQIAVHTFCKTVGSLLAQVMFS